MRLLRPLLAAACAAALAPATATASFPGANGIIAVTEDACESVAVTYIRAYTPTGDRAGPLTPPCDRYDSPGGEAVRGTWGPDFSPDGQRLLYAQGPGGDEPSRFETTAVAGGGAVTQAVSPESGLAPHVEPSFAPDGRQFAYLARNTLFVAPGDGGPAARLREAANHVGVRWAPNGRLMAVIRRGSEAQTGLWVIDAKTGHSHRRVAKGLLLSFDWSPDSRSLVFATAYGHDDRTGDITGANVYTVRRDGVGGPKLLVRTRKVAAVNPVWSPDGRSIAWVQMDYTPGDVAFRAYPSLWRKRVGGRRAQRLAALPSPTVEEGFHTVPDLAWQSRPAR
jgi:Tol biopolymer transport system component